MKESISKVRDLLSLIYLLRDRYLKAVSKIQISTPHIHHSTYVKPPFFSHAILALPSFEKSPGNTKRFELVKNLSENHFRIRYCLSHQNDHLFRYGAHYYKKKLTLHDFYHWKMAKLYSVSSRLKQPKKTPSTGSLRHITNLSQKEEEGHNYFKRFDRYRLDI